MTQITPPAIKKIVFATDFSEISEEAKRYATWLSQELGAALKVVHVFDPDAWQVPSPYYFMPGFDEWLKKHTDKSRVKAKETLNELEASFDGSVEALFAEGKAGKEIVRVCKEVNADLIVIGTHGYTGWNHLTLGSVAEYVVRHADCPRAIACQTLTNQVLKSHGVTSWSYCKTISSP